MERHLRLMCYHMSFRSKTHQSLTENTLALHQRNLWAENMLLQAIIQSSHRTLTLLKLRLVTRMTIIAPQVELGAVLNQKEIRTITTRTYPTVSWFLKLKRIPQILNSTCLRHGHHQLNSNNNRFKCSLNKINFFSSCSSNKHNPKTHTAI